LDITTDMVKQLREKSGAGVMDCRNALKSCGGDMEKAEATLKEKGLAKAEKKASRATGSGLVECYVHTAGRIGAMVEINCETDFVARTDEFKDLAHSIAMQVAAMSPVCVSKEPAPEGSEPVADEACLLLQPFIKDPTKTIQDVISETIAKTGENIKVRRFHRFELGN
jgi:elongation factor Ts